MISLVATFPLWKPPPIQDKVNLIREFSSVCGEVLVLHMDDRFRLLVSPAITLLLLSEETGNWPDLNSITFSDWSEWDQDSWRWILGHKCVLCTRGYIQSQSLEWKFGQRAFCTSKHSTQRNKTISLPQPLFSSISFIQLASQDGDLQSVNFFREAIIFGHVLSSIGEWVCKKEKFQSDWNLPCNSSRLLSTWASFRGDQRRS